MRQISTYKDFKACVVEPDFDEYMADKSDLRKAWHCAGSLYHLHDWVYAAHKVSIDAKRTYVDDQGRTQPVSCVKHFANSLGQAHSDFQLLRGIANASKHFVLRPPPPGRQNPPAMPCAAADTAVVGAVFQRGVFQPNVFQMGSVMLQAESGDIKFSKLAESALEMWNQQFRDEGW